MAESGWTHSKEPVSGANGMLTSRHPHAARAGAAVLRQGGNAVDAAISAIVATGVVQPFATTIGGGGVATVAAPGGRVHTVDYRSEAPAGASPDMYRAVRPSRGLYGWTGVRGEENESGHGAVATPGAIPGLVDVHRAFGRLPWPEVLAPAVSLARRGFEMDWFGTLMQGAHLDRLTRYELTAKTFLRDSRYPYRSASAHRGDTFRQPELARTLEEIAAAGLDGYLHGRFRASLIDEMSGNGGLITGADLADYRPRPLPVRRIGFRGHTVVGPSHGGIHELVLLVLERTGTPTGGMSSPLRLHVLAEVLRRCRRVESRCGDGIEPPWISRPGLPGEIAASIDPTSRHDGWFDAWWAEGSAVEPPAHENTAHVCAVDSDGTAVSLTETVLGPYGSGVTTAGGVLMNNAMNAFVPVPGHPNSVRAGRRPQSSMSPLVVLDGTGRPVLAAGASGGQRIPAAVVQVLLHILDWGLPPQAAVEAPRVDTADETLLLDSRFPVGVAAALERMGHTVEVVAEDISTLHFANPSVITAFEPGTLRAGVNPFSTTTAVGV